MTRIRCFAFTPLPLILLFLVVGLLTVSSAHATTATAADGGIVWCNGYLPPPQTAASLNAFVYPAIAGYSADTAPDGLTANPNNAWDAWQTNPAIDNPATASGTPANPSGLYPVNSNALGATAETVVPAAPTAADDRYAIQLDYWNSIASGLAIDEYDSKTGAIDGTTTPGSLGYSTGSACVLVYPGGSNAGEFVITYPANPSQSQANLLANYGVNNTTQPAADNVPTEAAWAAAHPDSFPYGNTANPAVGSSAHPAEPPYYYGPAAGGPTGYVSTYKGCAWDGNSCTEGSAVVPSTATTPPPPNPDWNVFPEVLSNITSIPTTWNIIFNSTYGDPKPAVDDGTHVWDASYDIWFDTTGKTGVGVGPGQYGTARGQNDGLEIMVWMNSQHSYVDAPDGPTPNATGYAQPSGWPREQVLINNVVYDVWTSRLNNPNFGASSATATYSNTNVLQAAGSAYPGGAEPYTCNTLATYWNTATASVGTNPTDVTCGTEWNVVSFVATKIGSTDYRGTSMSMDTKVFTDYILGINDGLWQQVQQSSFTTTYGNAANRIGAVPSGANATIGTLACPGSATYFQQDNPADGPTPCLSRNWLLTSVDAGFEPWEGGNGLESKAFVAHVNTVATTVQSGLTSGDGTPIVTQNSPFQIVYPGCPSTTTPITYTAPSSVTYLVYAPDGQGEGGPYPYIAAGPTMINGSPGVAGTIVPAGTAIPYGTPMEYPFDGTPGNMSLVAGSTTMFAATISPKIWPLSAEEGGSPATIVINADCGGTIQTSKILVWIDPSGQVFYSDGKTPVQGATVTLEYSPSGSASGPFEAVPNNNYGLSSQIMQPNDNTLNPMPSTQYGAYAWNVEPGYYEVNASLAGCGSVTSPVQQVVNYPITNLNLTLPCAPPPLPNLVPATIPSTPESLTATTASSSQINLSWGAVPLPPNATSVTYTVEEVSPTSTTIASGITATNYEVTGLNPNTSYSFAVVAVDAGGSSPQSTTVSSTTQQPQVPAGACHVTYTVQSATPGVNNGLTVSFNIQNTGSTALYPWTLSWTFPGNQQISYAWNAAETQSGANASLTSSASWESIPAGGTLYGAVGFNGIYTGTDAVPSAFYINGALCQ